LRIWGSGFPQSQENSKNHTHVQHIEFVDTAHFENNYYRVPPPAALSPFIDFFWETRFDELWEKYPKGFSDAQFPNIGYTYIINLGTPFIMQVGDRKLSMKTDGFLPRYNPIECFHKPGNHLFGIKFRISPVLLKKKINFSEYREYMYPLSYLLEPSIIEQVKTAQNFEERIDILSNYFFGELTRYEDSAQAVNIVRTIIDDCFQQNRFTDSVEMLASQYKISSRTLLRYFEMCTGVSCKQALQVMRIRKATSHLVNDPDTFDYLAYDYYDHSHFYKHLKQFLGGNSSRTVEPHIKLLELLHKD
jgi:AraC-like DNA-binding protein